MMKTYRRLSHTLCCLLVLIGCCLVSACEDEELDADKQFELFTGNYAGLWENEDGTFRINMGVQSSVTENGVEETYWSQDIRFVTTGHLEFSLINLPNYGDKKGYWFENIKMLSATKMTADVQHHKWVGESETPTIIYEKSMTLHKVEE